MDAQSRSICDEATMTRYVKTKQDDRARLRQYEKVAAAFKGFRPAAQVLTAVRAVPTRFIQVDHALRCGGWPVERFTLVHGPSNHGKTEFAAGLVDSFLSVGGLAHYIDAERTSPLPWFRTLMGANVDLPTFTADRPDTYEATMASVRNYLNLVIKLKNEGKLTRDLPAIIVCDSMRKLVPKDMMKEILSAEKAATAGDISGGRDRSAQLKAKMNAAWMDELVPHLEKAGAVFVAIGRELQDPDADQWARKFGTNYTIGGGGAMYFDASIASRIERVGWVDNGIKEAKERRIFGERHRVTVNKTKVASKDGKVVVAYYHTSNGNLVPEGFDRARDVLELGERLGTVERTGSWRSFEGERIGAGQNNAVKALAGNPGWLARIERATRARFGEVAPLGINEETGEVSE